MLASARTTLPQDGTQHSNPHSIGNGLKVESSMDQSSISTSTMAPRTLVILKGETHVDEDEQSSKRSCTTIETKGNQQKPKDETFNNQHQDVVSTVIEM